MAECDFFVKRQYSLTYYNDKEIYIDSDYKTFLKKNLKFSCTNGTIEITPILLSYILNNFITSHNSKVSSFLCEDTDFYFPLYSRYSEKVKTSTRLFSTPDYSGSGLLSSTIFRDNIYYKGQNMLLDKDLDALLFITYKIQNSVITDIILRVHPKIWESKDVVAKTIKNKIIPIWLHTDCSISIYSTYRSILNSSPYINKRLYIEDSNCFIQPTTTPNINFSDKEANKYILDNINLL